MQQPTAQYEGYPPPAQAPATVNVQQTVVITSQPTSNNDFLTQLGDGDITLKENYDCLGLCCRQLDLFDHGKNKQGYAKEVRPCCSSTIRHDVHDNHGLVRMKAIREYDCCELMCYRCYMCQDLKYMDIRNQNNAQLGSFEYVPKFCREECDFCGEYVIKNALGAHSYYVKRPPCCDCECDGCCCVPRLILWVPLPSLVHCGRLRRVNCLILSPLYIACPLFMRTIIPVRIHSKVDESHVATINKIVPPWFAQEFCCKKMKYKVENHNPQQPVDEKALMLGSALTMDTYGMYEALCSDRKATAEMPAATLA